MEGLRLNPYSEEYLFTSEEFPTREELTSFTEEVNTAVVRGTGTRECRDEPCWTEKIRVKRQ